MCGLVGLLVIIFLVAYYFWFVGVVPIVVLYVIGGLFVVILIGAIIRSVNQAR